MKMVRFHKTASFLCGQEWIDLFIKTTLTVNGSVLAKMQLNSSLKKELKVIGTDACSIDAVAGHPPLHDGLPPAHLVFLGAGIPHVEDLCNLSQLPTHFYVVIAPLKLARSSGAPTRVFAFV